VLTNAQQMKRKINLQYTFCKSKVNFSQKLLNTSGVEINTFAVTEVFQKLQLNSCRFLTSKTTDSQKYGRTVYFCVYFSVPKVRI